MQQTKKWAGILLIFLIITAFLTGGGAAVYDSRLRMRGFPGAPMHGK